jgi:hypothetical protein
MMNVHNILFELPIALVDHLIYTRIYMYRQKKRELHGFGPLANYVDRATAACILETPFY